MPLFVSVIFRGVPKLRETIERPLQDVARCVLIDHGCALLAADIGGDQIALDRRG